MGKRQHISYSCKVILELDIDAIQGITDLANYARADMDLGINISLWLRGLRPLRLPDPLSLDYSFTNSWEGILDIEGMIIATDGSGEEHSSDLRRRRCGFGIAILNPIFDSSFEVIGTSQGTVPKFEWSPLAAGVGSQTGKSQEKSW